MRLTRAAAVTTIAGCAAATAFAVIVSGGVTPLDGRLYDSALSIKRGLMTADEDPGRVAVIGLDARSLASEALAPYPRAFLGPVWGELIEALRQADAEVVAFDMLFIYSANRFQEGFDRDFIQALARHRDRIVLGRAEGSLPARPFLAALRFDEASLGFVEVVPDADGVVRRVPIRLARADGAGQVHSLAGAALARAGVEGVADEVLLAPRKHLEQIPTYALIDVLECARSAPDTLAAALDGRLVFIGTVLPDEDRKLPAGRYAAPRTAVAPDVAGCRLDRSPPSAPGRHHVPGVHLHAAAAEAVLTGEFARAAPLIAQASTAGTAAAFGAAAGLGLAPVYAFPLALGGAIALFAVMVVLLFGLVYYPAAFAIAALLLSAMLAYVIRYVLEERRRRRIQQAFGQYLSPELVRQLADAPSPPALGGEKREMTFLFCDIRDFTTLSERFQHDPEGLTRLVNRFLTAMSGIILERGGTIDKYIGDCIMAFWNAPLLEPDHARRACEAALAMRAGLDRLNLELQEESAQAGREFEPIAIGIGINTGPCVVGNLGSAQRFDYTVLGDAVNLASRLEAQSKHYGIAIVIGQQTAAAAHGIALVELDRIAVTGKREVVAIHTALDADPESRAFTELARKHAEMLVAYRARDWEKATALAWECRDAEPGLDSFYARYIERIEHFAVHPPPPDWGGVHVPDSK